MRQPDFSPGRIPPEWLKAISEAQKRAGPERHISHEEPTGSDDDPADSYGHAPELRSLIGRLKGERIGKGLTLGDIARLTAQARSAISRLESGEYVNPTLHTLFRYARALGWRVRLSAEPIGPEQECEDQASKASRK